jgi:hypothetical protein
MEVDAQFFVEHLRAEAAFSPVPAPGHGLSIGLSCRSRFVPRNFVCECVNEVRGISCMDDSMHTFPATLIYWVYQPSSTALSPCAWCDLKDEF